MPLVDVQRSHHLFFFPVGRRSVPCRVKKKLKGTCTDSGGLLSTEFGDPRLLRLCPAACGHLSLTFCEINAFAVIVVVVVVVAGPFFRLQALCSYLRGVLCLTAMLHASGVGDRKWWRHAAGPYWTLLNGDSLPQCILRVNDRRMISHLI